MSEGTGSLFEFLRRLGQVYLAGSGKRHLPSLRAAGASHSGRHYSSGGYYETRFETALRWLAKRCQKLARRFRYSDRGETGIRWWLERLDDWLVFFVIRRAWRRTDRV